MAQDERPTEILQLSKLVAWIDDQRKQDRELIGQLSQQVERFVADGRETGAQMIDVNDRLRQAQAALARLPATEAATQQLREQVAEVKREHQVLDERENRDRLVQQTDLTRTSKTLEEMIAQLAEYHRRDQETAGRVNLIAEEVKHDRVNVGLLPQRIEHVEKQLAAIQGGLHLSEEQIKRHDGQVTALVQSIEQIKAEQRKHDQWQQSTELRWARQLAEWVQQIEQWQHLLDDQANSLQQLTKSYLEASKAIDRLRASDGDNHETLERHQSELQRVGSVQEALREEMNRLMLSMDAQRRRVDEQAGGWRQLEEGLRQQSAEQAALSRRLDNEHSRVDLLAAALRQREQAQSDDRGELEGLQREMQALHFELEDGMARMGEAIRAAGRGFREALSELIAVEERQRRRQINDLEQEVREWREQTAEVAVDEH